MSGRLVILPKKSYCPWNAKNRERVLRDERLARERQEQTPTASIQSREAGGHVNLFEKEEEKRSHQKYNIKKEAKVGIMPVMLGQSAKSESLFYLQHNNDAPELPQKELDRKDSMDPMKAFCGGSSTSKSRSSTDNKRNVKKRKRIKYAEHKHHRSKHKKNSKPTNMDELRSRRREREASESKREESLREDSSLDGRNRRYQDQFYPTLSRK